MKTKTSEVEEVEGRGRPMPFLYCFDCDVIKVPYRDGVQRCPKCERQARSPMQEKWPAA